MASKRGCSALLVTGRIDVDCLVDAPARLTAVHYAVRCAGHSRQYTLALLRLLLDEYHASVDACPDRCFRRVVAARNGAICSSGSTPLLECARRADMVDVARLLLARRANVNARLADNDRTSLHYAVIRNDKPLFEALSAYQQLDASAIDTGGRTPLHYAVMSAQLLLVLQFLPSDLTDLVMWTLLNGFCSLLCFTTGARVYARLPSIEPHSPFVHNLLTTHCNKRFARLAGVMLRTLTVDVHVDLRHCATLATLTEHDARDFTYARRFGICDNKNAAMVRRRYDWLAQTSAAYARRLPTLRQLCERRVWQLLARGSKPTVEVRQLLNAVGCKRLVDCF